MLFRSVEKIYTKVKYYQYWGAPTGTLNNYSGKISAVLINTPKGQSFFDKSSSLLDYEITDVATIIKNNDQLQKPSIIHPDRKKFEKAYFGYQDFYKALKSTSIIGKVRSNRWKNVIFAFPRYIKHKLRIFPA